MNIARTGDQFNNDFVIEGNHARMSQRKVAEIIGISQKSVSKWTDTHLIDEIREIVKKKGFGGDTLNQIVGYYASSKSVKQEVRDNCVNLLIESSKLGFQALIDEMAGLSPFGAPNPQPQSREIKPELEVTPDLIANTIDLIFKGVNIKPEIVAGVKLNAIKKQYPMLGESVDNSMGILRENTASDVKLMTPSELGRLIGVSAQEINKRLIAHGLQTKNDGKKSRKDSTYLPTARGAEFSSYTLSTGKANNSTYQQLLWYESVLSLID